MSEEPSDQRDDSTPAGDRTAPDSTERNLQGPERGVAPRRDPNRMLSRRSPVKQSDAALVSRDYQPRVGGPELVASWPLGPPPSQTGPGDDDWEVTAPDYVTLQRNFLTVPYVAPIDCTILYLNVCGRARTSAGDVTLTLRLTSDHVECSGEPYETTISVSDEGGDYFVSPMVEFAPDTGEYKPGHDIVSGYGFEAKVSDGSGYVDQGSAVQLWSE
jgi:hypothetical protein